MDIIGGDKGQGKKAAYPIIAIGNFDGVHRGHQAILKQTVERARVKGGTGIVLTFDPHPLTVLAPMLDLKFLMSFEERVRWIERIGIQQVRSVPFTLQFANLTPPEFAQKILHDDMGAREVVVGVHFAFGKDRKGTVRDLQGMSSRLGFKVHAVEAFSIDGQAVSSSRIREYLVTGQAAEASRLLGRPHVLEGEVIPATRRGRALGYPTANFQPPPNRVIPENGVYAVQVELRGHILKGVTYIGTQPTLGPRERMVETYLFEPQADLYGLSIRVNFVDWIRPERIFGSKKELVDQMEADVRKAKTILRAR